MEDIIDIIVTETTNLIEITSQPTDEVIDVNIIDNREDITLNVTPSVVEININSLTGNFGVEWGDITGTLSNQTDLNTALSLKADLVDGKVPSSQLPSYVDDVVEVANYASLPATGEVGKIYITLDTNFIYRWTGSTYVEIKDSSAVWGAITGTLSNQTDLQSALDAKLNTTTAASTYVPYTGATSTLNLGLRDLIASAINITGANAGGAGVLNLAKASSRTVAGSGYLSVFSDTNIFGFVDWVSANTRTAQFSLASITDNATRTYTLPNTNGTLALTSDLHNAVTIGTANGLSLSTQVLSLGLASSSANGALSSTDWTTFNNKVSGTGDPGRYAMFTSSSNTISYGFIQTLSNITYVEGLGLSTLNGLEITGNYGGGSGGLKLKSYDESTSKAYIEFINTSGVFRLGIEGSSGGGILPGSTAYATVLTSGLTSKNLEFGTNNTKRLTLDGTTGAATFTSTITATGATLTGALSGTSASFSHLLTGASALFTSNVTIRPSAGYNAYFQTSGTAVRINYLNDALSANVGAAFRATDYSFQDGSGSAILTLASTGAATFSNSVTAQAIYATDATGSAILTTNGGGEGILSVNTANPLRVLINGGEKVRVTSAGNVGIGTTAPYSTLHVNQGNTSATFVTVGNNNGGALFGVQGGGSGLVSTYGNADLIFGRNYNSSFSETMRITSSGNVGIGTTAPMTFGGFTNLTIASSTTSNQAALFLVNSNTSIRGSFYTNGSSNLRIGTATSHDFLFDTADTERMRITSGGNVLVGTTTDYGGKLQVSGGITINGSITNLGTGTGTYTQSVWYNNTTDQVLFENGRTTDSAAGTGRTVYFTWRGGPSVGGGVQLQHGANAWAAYTSDARLKTIVANVDNGLEAIMKLNPIKYKWTKELETSRTVLGFTAQNVGEAIPEAMFKSWKDDELGDVLSYYQEYLTPYLVKAMQELKAELDTLKNK